MHSLESLVHYAPQHIFLVQGTEADFVALQQANKSTTVYFNAIARFTYAYALQLRALLTEHDGNHRTFCIFFSAFSPDAAQILLKPFESLDASITCVCMTPHPYMVPHTIRSRVVLLTNQTSNTLHEGVPWTYQSAVAYAKEAFSSENEEDASLKRARASIFLDDLERQYATDPKKIALLYEAKAMLFRANMPVKYVVEYAIALMC